MDNRCRLMRQVARWIGVAFCIGGFVACEDDEGDLGAGFRPKEDMVMVRTDTFQVKAETIRPERIYSISEKFLLGGYTDELLGTTEGSVLFGVKNPDISEVDNEASAEGASIAVFFSKHEGGGNLALNVYRMSTALDYRTKYYTDIDAMSYCEDDVMGQIALDDWVEIDTLIASGGHGKIEIELPKSFAEDLLSHKDLTTSEKDFADFLKGFYIANNDGNEILTVDSLSLNLRLLSEGSEIPDTIKFPANNEVRQVNALKYQGEIDADDDRAYLYAPVGYYMKLTIPYQRMLEKRDEEGFYDVKYNVAKVILRETEKLNGEKPQTLLMVRDKDYASFFEQRLLPTDSTAIYASKKIDENERVTYSFDIATRLQKLTNEGNGCDETFYIVPVRLIYTKTTSGSKLSEVQHDYALGTLEVQNPVEIELLYDTFYKYEPE